MKQILESIESALEVMEINQFNELKVIDESSLSRIYGHTKNRSMAIISADRGDETPDVNNVNKHKLVADLKKSGYGFIHGRGGFIEDHDTPNAKDVTGERSFVVVGPKNDDGGEFLNHMKTLGSRYKQESILHKPHDSEDASWHYTDKANAGKVTHQGKFHQDDKAMYYTSISGQKKKFSFGD